MNSLEITSQEDRRKRMDLIKSVYCKDATDEEASLFFMVAEKTGLRPELRQIASVPRWDSQARKNVRSIQVTIDGLRLVAERSGKYRGQIGPYWCGKDGVWHDVWLEETLPVAAKVGVYHADFKEPLWGVAKMSSFQQTKSSGDLNPLWNKMPDIMLAKCAESQSLRKAFPQEMSGIYTEEEMAQNYEAPITMPALPTVDEKNNERKVYLSEKITEAFDKDAITEEEYNTMRERLKGVVTDKMLDAGSTWIIQKIITHEKSKGVE